MPYHPTVDCNPFTTSVSTWAPELLLEAFQWLPLKSLIAAQGVNRQWRRLVPLTDIPPIRRALFNLYLDFLASPVFLPSRPAVLQNLRPFDREAYAAFFRDKGCPLPDEFLLWILEWPSKAVIDRIWPGMPLKPWNLLAAPPQMIKEIETIRVPSWKVRGKVFQTLAKEEHQQPNRVTMQALKIRSDPCDMVRWIILDGPRKELVGTLHVMEFGELRRENPCPPRWVEWLREMMRDMERKLETEHLLEKFKN